VRTIIALVIILLAGCSKENTLKCYVDHYEPSTGTVTKNVQVPCPKEARR